MSAGALVSQNPEIELFEEACEVGESGVDLGAREGADPEIGAYLDRILANEVVRILFVVLTALELDGRDGNGTATGT